MSDVISEEERHEAATEEPTNGAAGVRALPVKLPGGMDGVEPREKPLDPTAPEMKKASKFGLLKNGVQMIRYAGGPTVTLIGKRERDPSERQGGRTGKIIYKVVVSKETHSAEVIVDGKAVCTVFAKSGVRLERYGLAVLNSWLLFNKRTQRHKRERLNRRKAEANGQDARSPEKGGEK